MAKTAVVGQKGQAGSRVRGARAPTAASARKSANGTAARKSANGPLRARPPTAPPPRPATAAPCSTILPSPSRARHARRGRRRLQRAPAGAPQGRHRPARGRLQPDGRPQRRARGRARPRGRDHRPRGPHDRARPPARRHRRVEHRGRLGQRPDRRPGPPHHRGGARDRRGGRGRPQPEDGARDRGPPGQGRVRPHRHHGELDGRPALELRRRGDPRRTRGRYRRQAGRPGPGPRRRRHLEGPHRLGQLHGLQPDRPGPQHRPGHHRGGQRRPQPEDHRRREGRGARAQEHRSTRWSTSCRRSPTR